MIGESRMRKIRYHKPSITNLRGKKGRAILEEIMNAKPPALETLREEVEAYKRQILALKQDGK